MKNPLILTLILSALTLTSQASGGGGGGGGGGGKVEERDPRKVSAERFKRGQAVFEGRFQPSTRLTFSAKNSQARNLAQLQRKLAKKSEAAASQMDIGKLAGRLSPTDLRALRYYLDVKYLKSDDYGSEYNSKDKSSSKSK